MTCLWGQLVAISGYHAIIKKISIFLSSLDQQPKTPWTRTFPIVLEFIVSYRISKDKNDDSSYLELNVNKHETDLLKYYTFQSDDQGLPEGCIFNWQDNLYFFNTLTSLANVHHEL